MKLIDWYFDALRATIDAVAADSSAIEHAAALCVEAPTHGGAIHIYDSGHLVSHELI